MKESILYNIYQSGKYLSLLLFFLIACDDLEDKPSLVPGESGDVYETGTAEMYILSEGLFNQNNSSLARYSFNQQKRTSNYFSANNQRGLGDTANDMAIYGNKIYIVGSGSPAAHRRALHARGPRRGPCGRGAGRGSHRRRGGSRRRDCGARA